MLQVKRLIVVFLGMYGPFIVGLACWWRFLSLHEWKLTAVHIALVVLTWVLGSVFHTRTIKVLGGAEPVSPLLAHRGWYVLGPAVTLPILMWVWSAVALSGGCAWHNLNIGGEKLWKYAGNRSVIEETRRNLRGMGAVNSLFGSDKELVFVNLSRSDLTGATLRGADLGETVCDSVILDIADLRGTHTRGIRLVQPHLPIWRVYAAIGDTSSDFRGGGAVLVRNETEHSAWQDSVRAYKERFGVPWWRFLFGNPSRFDLERS